MYVVVVCFCEVMKKKRFYETKKTQKQITKGNVISSASFRTAIRDWVFPHQYTVGCYVLHIVLILVSLAGCQLLSMTSIQISKWMSFWGLAVAVDLVAFQLLKGMILILAGFITVSGNNNKSKCYGDAIHK